MFQPYPAPVPDILHGQNSCRQWMIIHNLIPVLICPDEAERGISFAADVHTI